MHRRQSSTINRQQELEAFLSQGRKQEVNFSHFQDSGPSQIFELIVLTSEKIVLWRLVNGLPAHFRLPLEAQKRHVLKLLKRSNEWNPSSWQIGWTENGKHKTQYSSYQLHKESAAIFCFLVHVFHFTGCIWFFNILVIISQLELTNKAVCI